MADGKREVDELRQEIAKVDAQLLVALDRRAKAARRLREVRKDQTPSLPLTDHAAIRALVARSTGDMPQEALRDILREIFAVCLALELPVKVSYVGPEGGPGHAAVGGRFGRGSAAFAAESTAAALEEVTRKRAEYAVVPFETVAEGPVQTTILALMATDLRIVEVLDAAFDLNLMNRTGNASDIEKIYATAADHAACQRVLTGQAPKASVLDVKSPLMACQLAVEDHGAAAIAGETFGAQLGLEVARRNVLDAGSERVRYAVVGARPSTRTGDDVTALVFSVQDAPGSLLDVLKVFAERGINLSNIQSHPVEGQTWQYLFYVDMAGHFTDRPLVMAFEEMRRITRFFKILGSYPSP
ncbi:MAG TPA: prephenate dehydratase domain-containing protein [Polyangiaceae bacterium]